MKTFSRGFLSLAVLMLTATALLHAQFDNPDVSWKLLTPTVSGKPGETVTVKVQAAIAEGSHMYTTKTYPPELLGPVSTTVKVTGDNLKKGGATRANKKAIKKVDENFDDLETEYWEGTVVFSVPVKIAAGTGSGSGEGMVSFEFMTCDATSCKPPTEKQLKFQLKVEEAEETAEADTAAGTETMAAVDTVSEETNDTSAVALADTGDAGEPGETSAAIAGSDKGDDDGDAAPTGSREEIDAAKEQGLWAFLGLAATMGALALLTPCVFPMIPITVSFFTKREQKSRSRALRDAFFYSLGIIFTFTLLGVVISGVFKATGVSDLASDPWVNLLIASVFVILSLNLFGMFEIQVPTSVLNKLNRTADSNQGVMGIVLMGLVFSLTSFTCTLPFVGGLLASAAQTGDWLYPIVGTAAFAAVFSAPFFLLALFPALLKSLPKSGGWLNSVKVVMGFLELAAAMKFFSNADLAWDWGVITREFFLAIWIAIAVLTTVYLLGRYQLPHDSPVEKVGPIRVMFATGALAVGFWLLAGMFGGPMGELEPYLPPTPYPGTEAVSTASIRAGGAHGASAEANGLIPEDAWIVDDYEEALALAKKENRPLFVDFTGYQCTNCRWMERKMFTRAEVAERMNRYILVRLYTDRKDEVNIRNRQMQYERFSDITLPYYALISPKDSVMAKFPGMTRNQDQFVNFLEEGLTGVQLAVK